LKWSWKSCRGEHDHSNRRVRLRPTDNHPSAWSRYSDYAEDVEVASIHRVLETLRAAINWGMAQTPPLFAKSPFHRFGVRLNKKAERLTEAGPFSLRADRDGQLDVGNSGEVALCEGAA
jgi:hypothetical protein